MCLLITAGPQKTDSPSNPKHLYLAFFITGVSGSMLVRAQFSALW